MTASIFLHIYGVVYYTIYMQSYFEVARETRFTNPLRIPHEAASSSLVSGECGYPRQRYSCDVVNHLTNYSYFHSVLHIIKQNINRLYIISHFFSEVNTLLKGFFKKSKKTLDKSNSG